MEGVGGGDEEVMAIEGEEEMAELGGGHIIGLLTLYIAIIVREVLV